MINFGIIALIAMHMSVNKLFLWEGTSGKRRIHGTRMYILYNRPGLLEAITQCFGKELGFWHHCIGWIEGLHSLDVPRPKQVRLHP